MRYFSQYEQDKFLNETLFKNKKDGFFVDIGASDPERQNNTLFFENLGWEGIVVEPMQREFLELKKHRKCAVENFAIYQNSGVYKFLACSGYIKGLSGLLCEQKSQHLNRIFNELLLYGDSVSIIEVQTITFDSLMKKYKRTEIDYLSLDTEGSEFSILKTIDFNKYNIKAISVENNYGGDYVQKYLMTFDFRKIKQLECDDIYIKWSE
jgi:FkbM family methyltransferase